MFHSCAQTPNDNHVKTGTYGPVFTWLGITPQVYNENNARYDEELSDLHRQEERLDEADKQFYITVGYLLAIFQHAERLFEVAEIDEKRQIIGLILSNLQLDDKKLSFNLKEPFATVLSHANGSLWLGFTILLEPIFSPNCNFSHAVCRPKADLPRQI